MKFCFASSNSRGLSISKWSKSILHPKLTLFQGIRTAIKSKNDHAYKVAYLKCTLNLKSNSKNEAFSLNISQENEGQSWYLRALFWKYL